MQCTQCGFQLNADAVFCGQCGTRVNWTEESRETPDTEPIRQEAAPQGGSQDKELFKVTATYEGGHPEFTKKQRENITLWPTRLDFGSDRKSLFSIPLDDIGGCELRPMQYSALRSMIGSDNRAIQTQTPMAFIACTISGFPCELRFHIHGAMTIPGESKKARELQDALNAAKFKSSLSSPPGAAVSTNPSSDMSDSAVPSNSATPGGTDADIIMGQIRQLAALHSEGILTDDEFSQKKAELLGRL